MKSYLAQLADVTRVILCSGNHDLDERNPEGAKIARWSGELRELAIACDGDSLAIGDTLFFSLPVVGRADVRQRIDEASRGGHAKAKANARSEAKAMDLGAPRAASQFPDQPGRQALFRRRRARAVDRMLPAFDGDLCSTAFRCPPSGTSRTLVFTAQSTQMTQLGPALWGVHDSRSANSGPNRRFLIVGGRCTGCVDGSLFPHRLPFDADDGSAGCASR